MEFPVGDGRTYERKGVATGELYRMFEKMKGESPGSDVNSGGNFSVSGLFVQFVNNNLLSLTFSSFPFSCEPTTDSLYP